MNPKPYVSSASAACVVPMAQVCAGLSGQEGPSALAHRLAAAAFQVGAAHTVMECFVMLHAQM